MRLLFDANLSPMLVRKVADIFPDSSHVADFGLEESDEAIWQFEVGHHFAIVTKDDDFEYKALLLAPPGKVILIRLGNCSTAAVDLLLRSHRDSVLRFLNSAPETILVLP